MINDEANWKRRNNINISLRGFTILGSSLTVAPARSHPADQRNPDTQGWCSLWATAPPVPPSPEGGDTYEQSKATQPVSRRRGSRGRGGEGETQTWICCPLWSLSRLLPSPGTDCCSGWWPHCRWLFSTAPPLWVPSLQQTLQERKKKNRIYDAARGERLILQCVILKRWICVLSSFTCIGVLQDLDDGGFVGHKVSLCNWRVDFHLVGFTKSRKQRKKTRNVTSGDQQTLFGCDLTISSEEALTIFDVRPAGLLHPLCHCQRQIDVSSVGGARS